MRSTPVLPGDGRWSSCTARLLSPAGTRPAAVRLYTCNGSVLIEFASSAMHAHASDTRRTLEVVTFSGAVVEYGTSPGCTVGAASARSSIRSVRLAQPPDEVRRTRMFVGYHHR